MGRDNAIVNFVLVKPAPQSPYILNSALGAEGAVTLSR